MSADAEVQDAMLGKGRCWLTDVPSHRCTDGYTQRSHIVSQQLIRDEFEFGAYWSDLEERWMPAMEDSYDYEALYTPMRTLQEILDDNRNFIPTCPNGNRDGAEMVEALGYAGLPEGFDEFCSEYGFEFMDGRYWGRRA